MRIIVGATADDIYIWHVDSVGNTLDTKSMHGKSLNIQCLKFYPKTTDSGSPILVNTSCGSIFFEKISVEPLDFKIFKRMHPGMHPKNDYFSCIKFNICPLFPIFFSGSCGTKDALLWRHSDDFSMVNPVASLGGDKDSVEFFEFLQTSPNLIVTAGRTDLKVWSVTPLGDVQHLQIFSYCDPSALSGIGKIAVNPKLPMIAVGSYGHPTKIYIVLPTGKLVLVAVLEDERCEGALAWDVDGNTLAIGTRTREHHPAGYTYISKEETHFTGPQ